MSFYNAGIQADTQWFPTTLEPLRDRAGAIVAGTSMVRESEKRFYKRGINPVVGAASGGGAGVLVDGVVNLVLDVMHILLLIGGVATVWAAVHP
jgi:hypothetical protein